MFRFFARPSSWLRSVRPRHLAAGLFAAAVLGAAACGDDTTGPGGTKYSLKTVDGSPVPRTVVLSDTSNLRFKSGSVVLKSGNTYSAHINVVAAGTALTLSNAGSYTREGSTIIFNPRGIPTDLTGTLDGKVLTLNFGIDVNSNGTADDTFTLVFRR